MIPCNACVDAFRKRVLSSFASIIVSKASYDTVVGRLALPTSLNTTPLRTPRGRHPSAGKARGPNLPHFERRGVV
ncbi:hypothetical protein PHBOTO_003973 [Pseudozyma hubeiensis]|nr:hypothetical protein PHBOTO_003973 [Pseudozyma hubeiensis]